MLHKESSDKEILDYQIPGTNETVRSIGSISFMAWIAGKLNGLNTYQAKTQELLGLVRNPPLGKLPENEKATIVRKLLELNVQV